MCDTMTEVFIKQESVDEEDIVETITAVESDEIENVAEQLQDQQLRSPVPGADVDQDAYPDAEDDQTSDADDDEDWNQESEMPLGIPFRLVDDESDQLNDAEKILSAFYKCATFPHECAFYSDDYKAFEQHLLQNHSDDPIFLCFYCNPRSRKYECPTHLIDHLLNDHSTTRFQCNLCFYRSAYAVHVLNHFVDCHVEEYRATTGEDDSKLEKRDEFMGEKINTASTTGTVNKCQILVCRMATHTANDRFDNDAFDDEKNRSERNKDIHPEKYQCCYCQVADKEEFIVAAHCAEHHPHQPPLMYLPKHEEEQDEFIGPIQEAESQEPEPDFQPLVLPISGPASATADPRLTRRQTSAAPPAPVSPPVIPDVEPDVHRTYAIGSSSTGAAHFDDEDDDLHVPDDYYDDRSGYITEEDRDRVKTDLEMSDDEEDVNGNARRVKKKVKTKKKPVFREEEEDDEEEETPEVIQHKLQSTNDRLRQHQNSIQKVTTNKISDQSQALSHKCLICGQKLRPNKVAHHLKQHQTTSTIKCRDCMFLGSKQEVRDHIKETHAGKGAIVKFIVAVEEEDASVIETVDRIMVNVKQSNGHVGKRSLANDIQPIQRKIRKKSDGDKDKGYLSRKVKESIYLGPGKNERTQKAQQQQSDPVPTSPLDEID